MVDSVTKYKNFFYNFFCMFFYQLIWSLADTYQCYLSLDRVEPQPSSPHPDSIWQSNPFHCTTQIGYENHRTDVICIWYSLSQQPSHQSLVYLPSGFKYMLNKWGNKIDPMIPGTISNFPKITLQDFSESKGRKQQWKVLISQQDSIVSGNWYTSPFFLAVWVGNGLMLFVFWPDFRGPIHWELWVLLTS